MDKKEPEPIYELEEGSSTPLYRDSRCCFFFPSCFPSRTRSSSSATSPLGPSFWERVGSSHNDDRWWARGLRSLKKLREWSEIVAGPRWKTFIRRFNRTRSGSGGGALVPNSHNRHGKFHYDALSYSLNFDEGPYSAEFEDEEADHVGFRNFSARYAAMPGLAKHASAPAMDMSGKGKEVPVFG